MNKLIVCGPADLTESDWLFEQIHDAVWSLGGRDNIEIVSSDTSGPDAAARHYADDRFVRCKVFSADWEHQGRFAGDVRNARIREHCYGHRTLVLVFGDLENINGIRNLVESKPVDFEIKMIPLPN